MNLIAQRPSHWNDIIGQPRAITVLQCVLNTARFLPRGFIFRGVLGVGKTTSAYIFAKALMCTGSDPLGCGACASCKTIEEQGINSHPDFLDVDGASKAGVVDARETLNTTESLPVLGGRRITIIDEAHRLSREAWDVYLKPLEAANTDSIFLFVTNDGDKIPATIQSRCLTVPFAEVDEELILGLLVKIANDNQIKYELDGLRIIAKKSKRIIRVAIGMLNTVASVGDVTKELVSVTLDDFLEELCVKTFMGIVHNDQKEAVKWVDEAGRGSLPAKVIETLFSVYAKSVFAEVGTPFAQIALRLPNVHEVDAIFVKWLATPYLPADVLPLVVYELINTLDVKVDSKSKSAAVSRSRASSPSTAGAVSPDELEQFLGETV